MKVADLNTPPKDLTNLCKIHCFSPLVVMGILIVVANHVPAMAMGLLVGLGLSALLIHSRLSTASLRPAGLSVPPSLLLPVMAGGHHLFLIFPSSTELQSQIYCSVKLLRPER